MQGTTSRLRSFAATAGIWLLSAGAMASSQLFAASAAGDLCNAALQSDGTIGRWNMELGPERTSTLTLSLPGNRTVLLVAREVHVDVDLVASTAGVAAGRTGNPIRREGVMRMLLRTDASGRATISLHAMVDGGVGTRVTLQAYPFDTLQPPTACQLVTQALAAGDATFAQARQISAGLAAANPGSAETLFDRAYQQYVQAFVALAPENRALRAEVAHRIAALLCKYLGLWREADHWSELAARLFELEGNANDRADAQSLQAWAWMELAQLPDAATAADPVRGDSQALFRKTLQQLQRLAAFYIKRHELFDAAEQLNYAGLTLYNAGEYERALESYGRAQKLYAGSGDHFHLALALQNIALVQWDLGRSAAALKTFRNALNLINTREYPDLSALILDNAGLANRTAGHLDTALAMHAQALELTAQVQDDSEHGLSLFGIGMVYSTAGDRQLAANFFRQALEVSGREGEGRDLVSVLRALAMVEAQDGHHEQAIRLDREALAHATGPIVRVHLLAQIADSESLLGRDQAATSDLALAGKIPQTDDALSRAVLAQERGVLDYRAGRLVEARTRLHAALATEQELGLDAAAFDAEVALARVDSAAGDSRQALRDLDAGLRLSEVLRVQVSDPELRATSMQPLRPAFELKVDLLAHAYQRANSSGNTQDADRAARDALTVTERSRSRVMQDIALADYSPRTEARVDHLRSQKAQLLGDLAAHEDRLEARGVRSTTDPRVAPIRADIAVLREQLALVDSQLAILSRPGFKHSHDRSRAIESPPPDTAIVSYWIGATDAYAWVQTQFQTRLIDLGPADPVRKSADAVHSAYNNPDGGTIEQRLHSGAQLSRLVLQPVLLQLPPSITRLAIVPDGPLHYVSFATLPIRPDAEDSFLIGKYEVAYGSSVANLLAKGGRTQPADGMLLVADAVYAKDDPRLVQTVAYHPTPAPDPLHLRSGFSATALERLPATATEASAIAQLAGHIKVDQLEGFQATREAVLSRSLERYRYIHFAVHATTDAEIPQLSSLVLSTYDNGGRRVEDRIWAGDLMDRRFNAQTVVLSACDTALGRDIGGEGLFSLRYVVLARGAQSVVASLWSVPDRSTATLMQAFYQGLLRENRRPETALTLAMRQMLRQGPRDPEFWGPFTATIASLQ
jgi:CHAT domain-containing protein